MSWNEVATPEAVDLAERAIVAALTTWSDANQTTFGFEVSEILDALQDEGSQANVLICVITIASIALTDLLGRASTDHMERVAQVHSAADVLRSLGGGPNVGVREPRRPYPQRPSGSSPPPQGFD